MQRAASVSSAAVAAVVVLATAGIVAAVVQDVEIVEVGGDSTGFRPLMLSNVVRYHAFGPNAPGALANSGMLSGGIGAAGTQVHTRLYDMTTAPGSNWTLATATPATAGDFTEAGYVEDSSYSEGLIVGVDKSTQNIVACDDPTTRDAELSFAATARQSLVSNQATLAVFDWPDAVEFFTVDMNGTDGIVISEYRTDRSEYPQVFSVAVRHVVAATMDPSSAAAAFDSSSNTLYVTWSAAGASHLHRSRVLPGADPVPLSTQQFSQSYSVHPFHLFALATGIPVIEVHDGRVFRLASEMPTRRRSARDAASSFDARGEAVSMWHILSWPVDDVTGEPQVASLSAFNDMNSIQDMVACRSSDGNVYLAVAGSPPSQSGHINIFWYLLAGDGSLNKLEDTIRVTEPARPLTTPYVVFSRPLGPGPHPRIGLMQRAGPLSAASITCPADPTDPAQTPEFPFVLVAVAVVGGLAIVFGVGSAVLFAMRSK